MIIDSFPGFPTTEWEGEYVNWETLSFVTYGTLNLDVKISSRFNDQLITLKLK